ncbi:uncharacterized protein I303_106453 [Kwoniella dejecticola CBS 10117]|uniref:Uncharacterized protein n=1 Tax=Kwoniella dejecticola CBS 10117 TaxID=1296121 RepID=A0AAJ8MJQ3_9TREE
MCPLTPPPVIQAKPLTPTNTRTLQALDRTVRRGEIDGKVAFMKTKRALERSFADEVLLQESQRRERAAEALDREVDSIGKQTRYPNGKVFDPDFPSEHPEELEEMRQREERSKRRKTAGAKKKAPAKQPARRNTKKRPSPPPVRNIRSTAVLDLEE